MFVTCLTNPNGFGQRYQSFSPVRMIFEKKKSSNKEIKRIWSTSIKPRHGMAHFPWISQTLEGFQVHAFASWRCCRDLVTRWILLSKITFTTHLALYDFKLSPGYLVMLWANSFLWAGCMKGVSNSPEHFMKSTIWLINPGDPFITQIHLHPKLLRIFLTYPQKW